MSDRVAKIANLNQRLGRRNRSELLAEIHPVDEGRRIFPQQETQRFQNFLRENIGTAGEFRGQGIKTLFFFKTLIFHFILRLSIGIFILN